MVKNQNKKVYLDQGRDSKGRFTTKKVIKKESWFTKKCRKLFCWIVKGSCCMFLVGCSLSKYQVVQEVNVNLYHLHNLGTNDVKLIITEDKLKVGEFYRLKDINIIATDKIEDVKN